MVAVLRSCLGVDIGSQSIRVAQIDLSKMGPRVVALLEEPIKIDPAQTLSEGQRQQLIARQLQELLKRAKIRTNQAIFCIPGQSVFIKRPPKLPKTTPERLDRIIRFEARQQIPFPLDKTLMEYQVFEEGEDATDVNVLMAAIKRDYVMNFMKLIKRTGLRAVAISVSSLALYNFHELNSATRDLLAPPKPAAKKKKDGKTPKAAPQAADKGKGAPKEKKGLFGLGKKKTEAAPEQAAAAEEEVPLEEMGFEEVRAYVNLGASLMDLAIPKPGSSRMIGFTRSVPLAGNEMDRLIREKLSLQTLDEARTIKESETVVLSTEFEVEGDAESVNMEASEAATAVADRIISELRRSLDYYISQPDGVAVDALVLSGGLARLRYLRSYIEEKMGLPVELAEVKHPQMHLPDTPPDPFCPFVVATGLALQGLSLAQNTINFLPDDVKSIQAASQRPFEMIGIAAMLLAVIGLNWGAGETPANQYQEESKQYQGMIADVRQQSEKFGQLKKKDLQIFEAYNSLAKSTTLRDYWLMVLKSAVLEKRPADVLIDEIYMRLDNNMIIRGKCATLANLMVFLAALNEENTFAIYGKPQFSTTSQITPRTDPRFTAQVYEFTITAHVLSRRTRLRTIGDQPVNQALNRNARRGPPAATAVPVVR